MIRLEHVSKIYQHGQQKIEALQDINLQVPKGCIAGVIGQSGAGKSTLIRCVNLLEKPTQGRVFVDQQELTLLSAQALRQARHQIGMIFQHFNLLTARTVFANVALPLELMHYDTRKIANRVESLLDLTGLSDLAHRYPAQLSGGQKQRVAIARALATEPRVLLCDEATSALDPQTTQSILDLLGEINQRLTLTILLITHEMEVAKTICDQVSLLESGRIVETASVGKFFTAPNSVQAQQFNERFKRLELPSSLASQLNPAISLTHQHPLLRLTFTDREVTAPIITQLARRFHIDINIHQARVEQIQTHRFGVMIAELMGDETSTQDVINQLRSASVEVEILGYVSTT